MRHKALSDVQLAFADLQGTLLYRATFTGADLSHTTLNDADLRGAALTGASLIDATLTGADLNRAMLTGADLSHATLTGANLREAILENVKLAGATVTSARWEAQGDPNTDDLYDLVGVETLWYCGRRNGPLNRLRNQFRDIGLRHHEREAAFALERTHTRYLLRDFSETYVNTCHGLFDPLPAPVSGDTVEGWFRYVFLELPVGYGLYVGRPWRVIGFLMGLGLAVYTAAIAFPVGAAGIYRVLPPDRLEAGGNAAPRIAADAPVERLHRIGLPAFGYGLYFSLLSAFHFGWRDFNVSTWLTKAQPSEFALRAHGWVRVVSGLQSLLSLYFLAMWALFYFGRPLQ